MANPMAWTGSIGARFSNYNLEGIMNNWGVREEVIKSGVFKDIGSSSRNVTPEERLLLQKLIDESFADFKADVVSGRKAVGKVVSDAVFDARILNSRQALQFGLIDLIGNIQDARKKAAHFGNFTLKGDDSICEFEKPFSLNSFLTGFSTTLAKSFTTSVKNELNSQGSLKLS